MNLFYILLPLCGLALTIYYINRSHYWANQPAMQYTQWVPEEQEGPIEDLSLRPPPTLPSSHFSWTQPSHQALRYFLAQHFIEYRLEHLQRIPDTFLVGLTRDGELVGTITGRPIELCLRGVRKRALYVDNLCLHPSLRTLKLAPLLIDKMAHLMGKNGIEVALFHKDGSPLPIAPVASFNYYGTEQLNGPEHYERKGYRFVCESPPEELMDIFRDRYDVYINELAPENWVLYNGEIPVAVTGLSYERPDVVKIEYHLSLSYSLTHDYYAGSLLAGRQVYIIGWPCHRSFIRTFLFKQMEKCHFYLYNYLFQTNYDKVLV